MMLEKVISFTSHGGVLYGLTDAGKLVRFDENQSAWVVRGSGFVLDEKSNIIALPEAKTARQTAIEAMNWVPEVKVPSSGNWKDVAFFVVIGSLFAWLLMDIFDILW